MNEPLKSLNENHHRFIDELFASVPLNATAAYVRVYGCARESAMVMGGHLMNDPLVKAEVERRQEQLRLDAGMTAVDVVRELGLLANADSRELSEHYVGACRYCHGTDHKYQRTPAEWDRDWQAYLIANAKLAKAGAVELDALGMHFNPQGGIGFTPKREPHLSCPECFGDGIGYEVFKDTRKLSQGAARLFDGVKRTKDGLEIKTRSRNDALKMAGEHLGIFKRSVELSGKDGAPIPIASISTMPTDPQEAAKIYQMLMGG